MTYCVGLRLNRGLVFMSDTRTNSGVDNISSFRKMFSFVTPGERVIVILTAGNLATTQALISLLEERTKAPAERSPSILKQPTMFQVARLVGDTLREIIGGHAQNGQRADSAFDASVILGGQIAGSEPRLFLIYPEGNFIEASDETPFFQIGETKYGRPIIVRAHDPDMSFAAAVKLLLVSFDSTIKANLSVGLPLDVQVMPADQFKLPGRIRITADDPNYLAVSSGWGEALKTALTDLPDFVFAEGTAP
jgi:putative proteasome-type protease